MRSQRSLAAAVAFAMLLPLVATAAQLCAMPGCAVEGGSGHDCCPPPESSLQASCCEGEPNATSLPPRLESGAQGAAADLPPAGLVPPGGTPALPVTAAPAAPAARELLARHCVLRI